MQRENELTKKTMVRFAKSFLSSFEDKNNEDDVYQLHWILGAVKRTLAELSDQNDLDLYPHESNVILRAVAKETQLVDLKYKLRSDLTKEEKNNLRHLACAIKAEQDGISHSECWQAYLGTIAQVGDKPTDVFKAKEEFNARYVLSRHFKNFGICQREHYFILDLIRDKFKLDEDKIAHYISLE
jgi:hypothetical protein